jgi:ferredoxin
LASYKVKLVSDEHNINQTIECDSSTYILDAAEDDSIDLPYSCRAGACSTCAGIVVEGEVDQSDQTFLDQGQMDAGFVLTCIAMPKTDCVIKVHQEEALY